MSVINKMLQDLDRRQAGPGPGAAAHPHVHVVPHAQGGREWFWRTLALLIVVALGWVAWVAYQMWPRPVATELAYRTAEEARARAAAPPPAPPAAESATPAAQPALATTPAPEPTAPAAAAPPLSQSPPETFRLAQSIQTPITEPAPARTPKTEAAKPAKVAAAPRGKAKEAAPKVERRDRLTSPAERAENEFRYAAAVLKLGRATEAEAHFARALELDADHRGARQALVVMHMERGELDTARQMLEDGLRLDHGQPDFAMALARIFIERKDLPGALAALDGSASAAAGVADFHTLRGTVLQRLGRHAEAVDAYRASLQLQSANPHAWLGVGISLEALGRRAEAAEAFRRALAAGPLTPEVKSYAEQRIRALR